MVDKILPVDEYIKLSGKQKADGFLAWVCSCNNWSNVKGTNAYFVDVLNAHEGHVLFAPKNTTHQLMAKVDI